MNHHQPNVHHMMISSQMTHFLLNISILEDVTHRNIVVVDTLLYLRSTYLFIYGLHQNILSSQANFQYQTYRSVINPSDCSCGCHASGHTSTLSSMLPGHHHTITAVCSTRLAAHVSSSINPTWYLWFCDYIVNNCTTRLSHLVLQTD